MRKAHDISGLSLQGTRLHMLVDGDVCDVDLAKESACLANASDKELENIEVSASGYGLHWPDLDEDLSIDGLIGVQHESCLLVAETRAKYGFTLLEVLVAMAILMIIVLMMATLFHQSSMAWDNGLRQAEMSIQARAAMSMIRKDLSQAVASGGYDGLLRCNISPGSSFSFPMIGGEADEDYRSVQKVSYSGGSSITRNSQRMSATGPGSYGNYGGGGNAKLLDNVSSFRIDTPGGAHYTTNLPEWVDISLTLEKSTVGAAGIKVWTKGRNIGSAEERKLNVKKKKLYTGDWDAINNLW